MMNGGKINLEKINILKIFLIIFIFSLLILLTIYSVNQSQVKKNQNVISQISNNQLNYLGKLKYKRENYNAVAIDDNRIIVIGKGEKNISKIAEIFDLRKRKTIKVINLINNYSDDFMYKLPNDNILIIGNNAIEIINLKTNKSYPFNLIDKNYRYTNGYAININANEILIILGNKGPIDIYKENKNVKIFIFNIRENKLEELRKSKNLNSLFMNLVNVKNPLIKVNNEIYLYSCDYNSKEILNGYKFKPINCCISKYNSNKKEFEVLKYIYSSGFPYNTIFVNKQDIILFSNQNILKYNILDNNIEMIFSQYSSFRYIVNYNNKQFLLLGSDNRIGENEIRKASFIFDSEKNKIYQSIFIDFKKAPFDWYRLGSVVQIQDKVIFIGLLGSNKIYSM